MSHVETISKIPQVKLVYKNDVPMDERIQLSDGNQAAKVFFDSWEMDTMDHHESFKVMYLNAANHVLGIPEISSCGISGTIVDIRIIFQYALLFNATQIILAHNHPSGNLNPSQSDKLITEKINNASDYMDIKLLDHIILTSEKHFSFANDGLI